MSKFFSLYRDYVANSEPPDIYHCWSAFSLLSNLVGKKCFIPQGHFTVYPQLYILLLGNSGNRKSTAMNFAQGLVRDCGIETFGSKSSAEGLTDYLAENEVKHTVGSIDASYRQAGIFADEMEVFLGGRHVNASMVSFLTEIWDVEEFVERKRNGNQKTTIENPYVTLLGCAVTDWLSKTLKERLLTAGLARRLILVYAAARKGYFANPIYGEREAQLHADLVTECLGMRSMAGGFMLTPKAMQVWEKVYIEIQEEANHHIELVRAYFTSKHILILKLALLMRITSSPKRLIDSRTLLLSYQVLNETEKDIDWLYGQVGRNELKPYLDELYNQIKKGPTTFAELLKENVVNLEMAELRDALNTLEQMHYIRASASSPSDISYTAIGDKSDAKVKIDVLHLLAEYECDESEAGTEGSILSTAALRQHQRMLLKKKAMKEETQEQLKTGKIKLHVRR
jgi:hypothetical protein